MGEEGSGDPQAYTNPPNAEYHVSGPGVRASGALITKPMPKSRLPLYLALSVYGCSAIEGEPWDVSKKGSKGWLNRAGIYEDYGVDTRLRFDTNNGPVDESYHTDLVGRLGLVTGLEYFVADDVSVQAGIDYRKFDAEETDGLKYDTIDEVGGFVGMRWLLPYYWADQGRLRPFVQGTLGYWPTTRFDFELDLDAPGTEDPELQFRGDDYVSVAASTGLVYQINRSLVFEVSALYEWPLGSTRDEDVELDLGLPSIPVIPIDTDLEPEGLIVLCGLTWYF